ncbi:MAG: hypothetical protein V1837_05200 [Candidatus Woesearchaeota archaeon]
MLNYNKINLKQLSTLHEIYATKDISQLVENLEIKPHSLLKVLERQAEAFPDLWDIERINYLKKEQHRRDQSLSKRNRRKKVKDTYQLFESMTKWSDYDAKALGATYLVHDWDVLQAYFSTKNQLVHEKLVELYEADKPAWGLSRILELKSQFNYRVFIGIKERVLRDYLRSVFLLKNPRLQRLSSLDHLIHQKKTTVEMAALLGTDQGWVQEYIRSRGLLPTTSFSSTPRFPCKCPLHY